MQGNLVNVYKTEAFADAAGGIAANGHLRGTAGADGGICSDRRGRAQAK